jgi:hypothetical protein
MYHNTGEICQEIVLKGSGHEIELNFFEENQ